MFDSISYFEGPNHERVHARENALLDDFLELLEEQWASFGLIGRGDVELIAQCTRRSKVAEGSSIEALAEALASGRVGHERFDIVRSFVLGLHAAFVEGKGKEFLEAMKAGQLEYTPDE